MKPKLPFDTNKLIQICKKNDVQKMELFGSFAREESTEKSDIDLLVKFNKPKSLLKFVGIERHISDVLGKKADLLTEASISPYIWNHIKSELEVIYEAR